MPAPILRLGGGNGLMVRNDFKMVPATGFEPVAP